MEYTGTPVLQSATIVLMENILSPASKNIKLAASTLIRGNLVAFPTETVYGLGADATNSLAVSEMYRVKGRPQGHPVIVHISSIETLEIWAKNIPDYALKLAKAFWPGPMTLILPRTQIAKNFITGGQDNVGVRVPSDTIAQELLKEFEAQGGIGVVAPSANRFGAVSPTSARDVQSELGQYISKETLILDGGRSFIGIESTVIYCVEARPKILRPGSISEKMIEKILGIKTQINCSNLSNPNIKAPGTLKSHYSPKARVLISGEPKSGDGFIALEKIATPKGVYRLAAPKTNIEFAYQLYGALRSADDKKIEKVYVVPPYGDDIAIAINDRLEKASCII